MIADDIVPRVGQFQWVIRDRVGGYTDTKDEAIKAAVAAVKEDGAYYSDFSDWAVGEVVDVTPRPDKINYWADGERFATVVTTMTIISGHAHHADTPVPTPLQSGSQGRSRS